MGLLFLDIMSIFRKCIYIQAFLFVLSFFRHFYINMSIIIQKLHTQFITIQKIYICLFLDTLSIYFGSDSMPTKLATTNHHHSNFSFFLHYIEETRFLKKIKKVLDVFQVMQYNSKCQEDNGSQVLDKLIMFLLLYYFYFHYD